MPQTSISLTPAAALPGMLAQAPVPGGIDSFAFEDAAGVLAGRAVVRGTAENQAKLVTDAASVAKFLGFTVYQPQKEYISSTVQYKQYDAVPVMKKGAIWLICSGVIAADAPLFIAHATGLPSALDDATTTAVPFGFLRCVQGAADGALGKFLINLP